MMVSKEKAMKEMQNEITSAVSRRDFLKRAGFASVALVTVSSVSSMLSAGGHSSPSWLGPQAAEAEVGRDVREVIRSTFGGRTIQSSHVVLKTPIIAENGAVVPINVDSDLPMEAGNYVKSIYIFVDENADPFIARSDLTPANGKAAFALRIKMRKTSLVRAIVETSNGELYSDTKTVKVTIGGCGG